MFKKTSALQVMGLLNKGSWSKVANVASHGSYFMNKAASSLTYSLAEKLDKVADEYQISRDPSNYLLIPARANSIGRLNANLDGWTYTELSENRPEIGMRTFETYNDKPHHVEHQASNPKMARGFILDAHLNLDNDATEADKEAVFKTIGQYPTKDAFVETVIAMDQTKDPVLADAYKSGAIDTFSMGADVVATQCNVCGNIAETPFKFCSHVNDKFSRREYKMADGSTRLGGELCLGTTFTELSVVSDPADKTAIIQEGLLNIQKAASSSDPRALQELASFTAKYASVIPDSLAILINQALNK